jgi:hypothetical protein
VTGVQTCALPIFPELRKSYYSQIEMKKKYQGLQDWIKKLKEEAQIKVYK